jgi:hypothetical protein
MRAIIAGVRSLRSAQMMNRSRAVEDDAAARPVFVFVRPHNGAQGGIDSPIAAPVRPGFVMARAVGQAIAIGLGLVQRAACGEQPRFVLRRLYQPEYSNLRRFARRYSGHAVSRPSLRSVPWHSRCARIMQRMKSAGTVRAALVFSRIRWSRRTCLIRLQPFVGPPRAFWPPPRVGRSRRAPEPSLRDDALCDCASLMRASMFHPFFDPPFFYLFNGYAHLRYFADGCRRIAPISPSIAILTRTCARAHRTGLTWKMAASVCIHQSSR